VLRIRCPNCKKPFIWTDDMPPKGKCLNPDCEGVYDIHESLRENLAARTPAPAPSLRCPACGQAIPSRWAWCTGCGKFAAGSRTFRKRDLLLMAVIVLLLLSLFVRYAF
jgi:predicted nucleic acid-binding Zn ribbon protein